MYVCVCNGVTESAIRQAVATGMHSLKQLRQHLGVAGECGRCATCAKRVVQEALPDCGACEGECRQSAAA